MHPFISRCALCLCIALHAALLSAPSKAAVQAAAGVKDADGGERDTGLYDVRAGMFFPKAENVHEDSWQQFQSSPRRLRRWVKQDESADEHSDINMDEKEVLIKDVNGLARPKALLRNGFEWAPLNPALLPLFREIHANGLGEATRAGPSLAEAEEGSERAKGMDERLARALQGRDTYAVADHMVYNFRCSGFVVRRGGPLGSAALGLGGGGSGGGAGRFDGVARRVHIDQDLEGEPLVSMGVKWVFQTIPFMHIVNVWTPLHNPAIRPLAMMDLAQGFSEETMLRYQTNSTKNAGGRFGSFKSDRLMTLHSDSQQWFWDPRMEFGSALLFLTGHTPHSSFSVLPAEHTLTEQLAALVGGPDCAHLPRAMPADALKATPPITRQLVLDTEKALRKLCSGQLSEKEVRQLSQATIKGLSRSSLEIRCAAAVVPTSFVAWLVASVLLFAVFLAKFARARSAQPAAAEKKNQ